MMVQCWVAKSLEVRWPGLLASQADMSVCALDGHNSCPDSAGTGNNLSLPRSPRRLVHLHDVAAPVN